MKVIHAFSQIFAIFAFLTLGSLMIILSMHILSIEDAIAKLHEVYNNPWLSLRTGFLGLLFIMVGLSFARTLVKNGRETDALIISGENGPIVLTMTAIEDAVKKVLKKFHLIKDWKIKSEVRGKSLYIKMHFVLWSGSKIPELLSEVQREVTIRLSKLITSENRVEVACDVLRIEDYDAEFVPEENSAVSV